LGRFSEAMLVIGRRSAEELTDETCWATAASLAVC
jgi:hypothetical protein